VALDKAPWAEDKMRVIHNGVDVRRFSPRSEPRGGGPPRLVVVGRLERRKGIDRAIVALSLLPEATLEIVGDGEERAALAQLARARGVEGRVRFSGMVKDTRDALGRADAVVCSSRKEGLGIALLEGMAMGKPVVAVPVGGVPEIVQDGETGWLARDESAEALAATLRDALGAPAELRRRGDRARAFVEREMSVEKMCERYEAEYLALAGRGA
jgi:glycosyltransferase involved in cell wall biosynthesis